MTLLLLACADLDRVSSSTDPVDEAPVEEGTVVPDGTDDGSEPADGSSDDAPWEAPAELVPYGERRCDDFAVGETFDPEDWGPYPVGVRTLEITDPLRPDRPLTTEVWYPAAESARGQEGETYGIGTEELTELAGDDWGALAALLALVWGDGDLLTLVETNAVRDAELAEADPNRSLVLFSHGYRGVRYQSTFFTTWLASHGYVVAAPDHVGNTMFDGSSSDWESVVERIDDLAAVTSAMAEQADSGTFADFFDPARVAWTGHSFGASTVLMAGAMDNRELVGISLAPMFYEDMHGVYDPESYDTRSAMLVLGGSEDTTCPLEHQEEAYARTAAPKALGELDGARHFDFTDLCANNLFRYGITSFVDELSDACGDDPTAYHHDIQALSTAYLNRYLACDAEVVPSEVDTDELAGWWEEIGGGEPDSATPVGPWDGTPAGGEAVSVELDGQVAAVERYGDGQPLVLLHGDFGDSRVFWPHVDALAVDHEVVLVDFPGHGAASGSAPSLEDRAALVGAIVQSLDLVDPVLVGTDSGGAVALLASEHAAGVVTVGTAPSTALRWTEQFDYNGGWTLDLEHVLGTDGDVASRLLADNADPDHVDAVRAELDEQPSGTLGDRLAAAEPDLLGRLADIEVPVLVVHGEQDDAVLLETASFLVGQLPSASLATFQRSGHRPHTEEPEAFRAAVLGFVAGL